MGASKDLFGKIFNEIENQLNAHQEGEVSTLDTLLYLRNFRQKAEQITDAVKQFENDNIEKIATEADKYDGRYCGFEVKRVKGREGFKWDSVTEVKEHESKVKDIKKKYKIAFAGHQKGAIITQEVDGVLYWVDGDGSLNPFPEKTYGVSYVTVKEIKQK